METVVAILIIIASLALIVTVLLQSGSDSGLGAAYGQGGSDTYLSRSKAKTFEAKLALGTKITAAAFVVLCLIMLLF